VYLWLKVYVLCEWCDCDVYLWLKLYILCEQCNCESSVCSWRCWFHLSGVVVIEDVEFMWMVWLWLTLLILCELVWLKMLILCEWCDSLMVIVDVDVTWAVWLWLNMLILHEWCGHDRTRRFYISSVLMTEDADFTWAVWLWWTGRWPGVLSVHGSSVVIQPLPEEMVPHHQGHCSLPQRWNFAGRGFTF